LFGEQGSAQSAEHRSAKLIGNQLGECIGPVAHGMFVGRIKLGETL
jgi:hypothetical protein